METKRTLFYHKHIEQGARLVDFAGWEMPIQYPAGIVGEHLTTRKSAGLFDVSHMGRFSIRGANAAAFLDYALTGYAGGLETGSSHYTILAQPDGGAVDDAWLYRFDNDGFILVVNASNKDKDWKHLQGLVKSFSNVEMEDLCEKLAMLALQGPKSEDILKTLLTGGSLPAPKRNAASVAVLAGREVRIGRTGYTGEPVCFEMMMQAADAEYLWDMLIKNGASVVGLGARDTLRLEASLPLYGHEMGTDIDSKVIPILACPAAKLAVADIDKKKDFIGKAAIQRQLAALEHYKKGNFSNTSDLPRRIVSLRILDKGIVRQGAKIFSGGRDAGYVTSGTMVPCWKPDESMRPTEQTDQRAVALAYVDCKLAAGAEVEVDVRGRMLKAKIVRKNLKSAGIYAVAVFE
ncbi:MAG: glycine cleavage system aminomethyltransferase GcvT [Planctomycetes bacterium]|nr:glycine cleavage system aminomethyltransferase GcvT [Planctomycetota bacterium]